MDCRICIHCNADDKADDTLNHVGSRQKDKHVVIDALLNQVIKLGMSETAERITESKKYKK